MRLHPIVTVYLIQAQQTKRSLKDFHRNNCSGIMSKGHSAAGFIAKKFIVPVQSSLLSCGHRGGIPELVPAPVREKGRRQP